MGSRGQGCTPPPPAGAAEQGGSQARSRPLSRPALTRTFHVAPFSLEALVTLAGLWFPLGLLSKSVRKSGGSAGLGQRAASRDSQELSGDGRSPAGTSVPEPGAQATCLGPDMTAEPGSGEALPVAMTPQEKRCQEAGGEGRARRPRVHTPHAGTTGPDATCLPQGRPRVKGTSGPTVRPVPTLGRLEEGLTEAGQEQAGVTRGGQRLPEGASPRLLGLRLVDLRGAAGPAEVVDGPGAPGPRGLLQQGETANLMAVGPCRPGLEGEVRGARGQQEPRGLHQAPSG